jgi:diacylglycerol kinase family enzyme
MGGIFSPGIHPCRVVLRDRVAASMNRVSKEPWLARLAIALAAGAVVVLVVFAGLHSVALIGFSAAGLCVTVACVYWFLARRGVVRWIALAFAALAPVAVAAIFATRGVLWVAIVVIAMLLAAAATAKIAMGPPAAPPVTERKAEPPKHAFLIMNPHSGGGKVGKFGLKEKAESLGAEVVMLEGPGHVDVAAIAERAVADGADLLGVAGGDGTQALVAGIAAAHGLPFLCISAGTRNHFAMDLGLDRDDPAAGLDALRDGIERRIDLGLIGDRTFVNNASFGVYAEIVQSPAYRDDKRGTTLQMLPDLLGGGGEQNKLAAYVAETKIDAPQAVLVSNNSYELSDIAGLGRRDRLDAAELGVIAIKVDNAAQAIGLARAGRGTGLVAMSSREVTVDSPHPEIPVGIDGETVLMPTPVHCSVQPGALRVVVPKDRPGVPAPRAPLSLATLGHLAVFGAGLCAYDG